MEQDRDQHARATAGGGLSEGEDEAFEPLRPALLGLAYRMLGSMWDAEDVVQDAWLRWAGTDRAAVEDPRKYLMTVTSRLAIDRLRRAYRQREAYVGPWLPEPVSSEQLPPEPAEAAERRDTVSMAVLRLMEELSPPERAVFVLREAFALPYDDIAATLELAAPNARQLHHRALRRITAGQQRFSGDRAALRRLVDGFTIAARTGDRQALEHLLAEEVALWTDGGGKVRAARRVIHGRDRVLRFLAGVTTKYGTPTWEVVEVNGQPALLVWLADRIQVIAFEVTEAGISGIQLIANPDKLAHVVPAGTSPAAAGKEPRQGPSGDLPSARAHVDGGRPRLRAPGRRSGPAW
jgi:RNA polymerase sigma-70 factor, ECF subfamily